MSEYVLYQIGRPGDGCNRGCRRRGETRRSRRRGQGRRRKHAERAPIPASRTTITSEISTHEGLIDAGRKKVPLPHRSWVRTRRWQRSCARRPISGQQPGWCAARRGGCCARIRAGRSTSCTVHRSGQRITPGRRCNPSRCHAASPGGRIAAGRGNQRAVVCPTSVDPHRGRGRRKVDGDFLWLSGGRSHLRYHAKLQ